MAIYDLINISERQKAINFLHDNIGKLIKLERFNPTRTNQQNNSIHLFCSWIAGILFDRGEMYESPMGIEIPWSMKLVKETYWRATQLIITGKESTTKLTTDEVGQIADVIIMYFVKRGESLEFPNMQAFLNHIGEKNYESKNKTQDENETDLY